MVTNGHKRFRRLLADGSLDARQVSRVAVSFDSLDPEIQDMLRGAGAWRDATETIELLRKNGVLFDINVTAVSAVLDGLPALIDYARAGWLPAGEHPLAVQHGDWPFARR